MCVDWIHVAQDRVCWSALVNTITILQVQRLGISYDYVNNFYLIKKDSTPWICLLYLRRKPKLLSCPGILNCDAV
jgi:hypothetical protein